MKSLQRLYRPSPQEDTRFFSYPIPFFLCAYYKCVSSPLINVLLQLLILFAVLAISLRLPVEFQAFPAFYLAGKKNLIQTPPLYPLEQNNHLLPCSAKAGL